MSDIAHEAKKELAESESERHTAKANKALESHEPAKAVTHLRKAAEAYETLASLENLPSPEEVYRHQSEKFRTLADELEQRGMAALQTAGSPDLSSGGPNSAGGGDPQAGNETGPAVHGDGPTIEIETPDVSFSDVGGLGDVKQTLLDKIADPIRRKELYEKYRIEPVRGVLFQGPPGTGKTLLARALGGELEWEFIELTPAEINSALVGEGAKNIKEVFSTAKEHQPCILFFDEIENIAKDRTSSTQSTRSEEALLTQLLTEMNNLSDADVIVIGATNQPEEVDEALLNARRFSEIVEFPFPDPEARKAILRVHLRDRPVPMEDIDFEQVAERTAGFTGADLEQVADNAAHYAVEHTEEAGRQVPITQAHLEQGIEDRRQQLENGNRGGYLEGAAPTDQEAGR